MLLANSGVFIKDDKTKAIIMMLSFGVSIVWVAFMIEDRLPFDRWMSPYWGDGSSPASVNCMVYSLVVLLFCYCFFALLYESKSSIIRKIVAVFSFYGRNTLYIWLYHLIIKNIVAEKFSNMGERGAGIRILMFGLIISLPVIMKQSTDTLQNFYEMQIKQKKTVQ